MIRETIIHKILGRHYRLNVSVDRGSGPTVVMLHGIAATALTYTHVIPLVATNCRVVCLELLGFGQSPKPKWKTYSVADHADSVLATLRSKRIRGPIVLVGHSMGGLIAVEIAKRRPELVKHLFLCSMPLYKTYADEAAERASRVDSAYQQVYEYLLANPALTLRRAEFVARYLPAAAGFDLSESNWLAFERSLGNTILRQNTLSSAAHLLMPVDLFVGRLDPFVIKRYLKEFVAEHDNMTLTSVNSAHDINENYAKALAAKIIATTKS